MKKLDRCQIVGWIGVGLSIIITCFWAFWGIIESFHEGWYYESLLANLGLTFVQYLSPMLIAPAVTNLTGVGSGYVNIEAVSPYMRVGLKANTPVAADDITVWAIGEMHQEV